MSLEVNIKDKITTKYSINYVNLQGRGGRFLITPIGRDKIFTREAFSEDQ